MLTTPRDERGAVAVIYALVAVLLLTVAALAVDLGNQVTRRTSNQSQADFAALAGGEELTATVTAAGTPSADVVQAVTDYLNNNQPQDDESACWRNNPPNCVSASQLTDGDPDNGEVSYTSLGLRVVAPRTWVDFGFANVIGAEGSYVQTEATVNVETGGSRVMPMYAVSGCDWGRQSLTDPANNAAPIVPTLAYDTETNTTEIDASSATNPTLLDSSSATVTELAPGSTGNLISFSARKFDTTRAIGFFRSDSTATADVVQQPTFWLQSDSGRNDLSTDTEPTSYTSNPGQTVQAFIPDTVTAVTGVWWVRVLNGTGASARWSDKNDALPIRVGTSVLECASSSTEGNFGTLDLPRLTPNQTAEHLPANIALGLQAPLTPTVHEWATLPANAALAGECEHDYDGVEDEGTDAVVSWGSNLRPGTNCVGTDPGITTTAADKGMIKGGTGYDGLLTTRQTSAGCAPDNTDAWRTVTLNNRPYNLNNDTLSCYLNPGYNLAQVADDSYSRDDDGVAFSDEIFSSPRFVYVPVLATDPGTGAQAQDQGYSIIDFRPGFFTDEQALTTATADGAYTGTANNGVTVDNSGITQLRVFFFSYEALPENGNHPTMPYLGVGPKEIRILD